VLLCAGGLRKSKESTKKRFRTREGHRWEKSAKAAKKFASPRGIPTKIAKEKRKRSNGSGAKVHQGKERMVRIVPAKVSPTTRENGLGRGKTESKECAKNPRGTG